MFSEVYGVGGDFKLSDFYKASNWDFFISSNSIDPVSNTDDIDNWKSFRNYYLNQVDVKAVCYDPHYDLQRFCTSDARDIDLTFVQVQMAGTRSYSDWCDESKKPLLHLELLGFECGKEFQREMVFLCGSGLNCL